MPGTVRKIIERIKEQRSSGNSVVALTVETRLVLQGFDPQRFEYDTPDDPGRLARIREIAQEMHVAVDDLVASADAEPDPDAAPVPPPEPEGGGPPEGLSRTAQDAAAAAGLGSQGGVAPSPRPRVPSNHPLREFKRLADEALHESPSGNHGADSGAPFATLVKSSLLMGLYSIHTDTVFCDQLHYNALFEWFLDRSPGDAGFDADAFGRDRQHVLGSPPSRAFFDRVVPEAARQKLFSSPLLQANGRQIKGWMSQRAG